MSELKTIGKMHENADDHERFYNRASIVKDGSLFYVDFYNTEDDGELYLTFHSALDVRKVYKEKVKDLFTDTEMIKPVGDY